MRRVVTPGASSAAAICFRPAFFVAPETRTDPESGPRALMFLALYTLFRSVNMSLQVLSALPMAAIGAVAALVVTQQSLTVASMVGFISLAGIASRNGILLIAHYLHLVKYEGEQFTPQMIERAGKERLAPMLMTALCAGIALVPLVLAAGEPGKSLAFEERYFLGGASSSVRSKSIFVSPAW